MNRVQMRDRVSARLRIPKQGDEQITPKVINDALNEALRTFSRARRWPWLLTSVAKTITTSATATLPTDYVAAGQLVNDDDVVIPYVGMEELLTGRGRYAWSDDGTNVRVEPAPTASFATTLWYFRSEPDLDDDTDSPLAPAAWHDPIVLWAAHICATEQRNYEQAAAYATQYDRAIAEMDKAIFRKKSGVRVALRSQRSASAARWA